MLTYIQINAAKPGAKAWTVSDSQGLLLQIQPNGSKAIVLIPENFSIERIWLRKGTWAAGPS